MNITQKDHAYLGRGEGDHRPLVVVGAEGPYVYDEKGKRYIDFFMGWCVGNIGWNLKEVVKKIAGFEGPTYVSPTYIYKGWVELAELLAKIAPGNLKKSFRATGGTEAVEIALQAAMFHTKRHEFISIEGSYHGHSIGAMSIGSSGFRSWYENLLPGCHKIKPPLDERAALEVEQILKTKKIAAFIAEPIVCNLAVEIPTKKFWYMVSASCKKYGTVLITDEVASGFGRTGAMFACEHYGLQPDIMCIAKGATGGYGALGAAIMTPEIAKSFEFDFSFYSTFGWHPLNVEATLQSLRYMVKHQKSLFKNASAISHYFDQRLRAMRFPERTGIRVKGLAIGVVFEDAKVSKNLILACLKHGLLIAGAEGNSIVIYPPLNLNMHTAKEGLDIFETCVRKM